MADAKVKFGAKNIFGLDPSKFDVLSSSENKTHEYAESQDFQGDLSLACPYNDQIAQQASYKYKVSTASVSLIPDILAIGLRLGRFLGQGVITAIEFTFSNTEQLSINITGHQHDTINGGKAHDASDLLAEWDLDLANIIANIPDCMGVPSGGVFSNSNPESTMTSLTLSFSCDHTDENDNKGQHFAGNNGNGRVTASASFIGEPNIIVPAGWYVTEEPTGPTSSNTGFYTTSISAYKVIPRYNYLGLWDASSNTPSLADGIGNDAEYYKVSIFGSVSTGAGVIDYEINDQLQYISGPNVWRNMHKYRGDFDAALNLPALADGIGKLADYYEVSVAGSPDFGSGAVVLAVGDVLKYNSSAWIKA
jgi:hypothetical protein